VTDRKVVVGRIEQLEGRRVLMPLDKKVEVTNYQKKVAALIAAAYVYKAEHTVASIERLKRCAEDLPD